MRFFIVCRAFVDWQNLTSLDTTPNRSIGGRRQNFRRLFNLWNKSFSISYFGTRHRLYCLARKSWEEVNGVDGIFLEGKDAKAELRTGDVVLPIDDDDWYAPSLVDELKRVIPAECSDVRLFKWNTFRIDWKFKGPLIHRCNRSEKRFASTNSYGFRWDQEWGGKKGLITCHVRTGMVRRGRNIGLDRYLSLNNKTLLSLTKMNTMGMISRSDHYADVLRRSIDSPIEIEGNDTEWFSPYVEGTKRIFQEVLDSRKT